MFNETSGDAPAAEPVVEQVVKAEVEPELPKAELVRRTAR